MAFILLADDDAALARLLQEHLEAGGHEVEVAEDGAAAVKKALSRRPDLLILDVHMPGMSGPDAFKSLDEDFTRSVPAVFISGLPPEEARKQTFLPLWSRGRLLHKPMDLAKLDATIADLLK